MPFAVDDSGIGISETICTCAESGQVDKLMDDGFHA